MGHNTAELNMDIFAKRLANAMRKDRARKKETLAQYAERTGIDIAKVSRIENCKSPVTVALLIDLSKKTGINFNLTII